MRQLLDALLPQARMSICAMVVPPAMPSLVEIELTP
jgi:hypothetical protein